MNLGLMYEYLGYLQSRSIIDRATFCAQCRRRFTEVPGDHCYISRLPGHSYGLVCGECHAKQVAERPK